MFYGGSPSLRSGKRAFFTNDTFSFYLLGFIWVTECWLLLDFWALDLNRSSYLVPQFLPVFFFILFFYWTYVFVITVWRRALFGRFTRGDRVLWVKLFVSFWVAELVTLVSIVFIYYWLSWGPLVLTPRQFLVSSRGFTLEIFIYSYLFFLVHVLRLSLSWGSLRFQVLVVLLILSFFVVLLWRDFAVFWGRDSYTTGGGFKWRYIRSSLVVFTLSQEWWISNFIGGRASGTLFPTLPAAFSALKSPFQPLLASSIYEGSLQASYFGGSSYLKHSGALANDCLFLQSSWAYPTRVGFLPKRFSLWQFLTFLKIWHHLVILLWFILYLFRLLWARSGSFVLLSVCTFNIYCCFLIAWCIYSCHLAVFWELFLHWSPLNSSFGRFWVLFNSILEHQLSGFGLSSSFDELFLCFQRCCRAQLCAVPDYLVGL